MKPHIVEVTDLETNLVVEEIPVCNRKWGKQIKCNLKHKKYKDKKYQIWIRLDKSNEETTKQSNP